MFPGWKSATSDEIQVSGALQRRPLPAEQGLCPATQALLETIDPSATKDRRNDRYSLPVERRTNIMLMRLRRNLFNAALDFATSVDESQRAEFKSVFPPPKTKQRASAERYSGNDYYSKAGGENSKHLMTHAPWSVARAARATSPSALTRVQDRSSSLAYQKALARLCQGARRLLRQPRH